MRNATWQAMLLLGVTAAWLGGCHAGPAVDARDVQPMRDGQGQRRSLAFASPQQRELVAAADLPPGQPWFASRNDQHPAVEAGVELETVERSATVTVDRQRVIRGRAYQDYRQTTFRQQIRESRH